MTDVQSSMQSLEEVPSMIASVGAALLEKANTPAGREMLAAGLTMAAAAASAALTKRTAPPGTTGPRPHRSRPVRWQQQPTPRLTTRRSESRVWRRRRAAGWGRAAPQWARTAVFCIWV